MKFLMPRASVVLHILEQMGKREVHFLHKDGGVLLIPIYPDITPASFMRYSLTANTNTYLWTRDKGISQIVEETLTAMDQTKGDYVLGPPLIVTKLKNTYGW